MDNVFLRELLRKDNVVQALHKGLLKGIKKRTIRKWMTPRFRKELVARIVMGEFHITRPWTAEIPKDNGKIDPETGKPECRTVFVNEEDERIFAAIMTMLAFRMTKGMGYVHASCKSYQSGIGCQHIVQDLSRHIVRSKGRKWDYSKFFDKVKRERIMEVFDRLERDFGKDMAMDVIREYYWLDEYWDSKRKCVVSGEAAYKSLKQGFAFASFLADVIPYEQDERISKLDGYYVRYSDDSIFIGPDYMKAHEIIRETCEWMGTPLNDDKVEDIHPHRFVKFLGYAIRGKDVSLNAKWVAHFVEEVCKRTIDRKGATYESALRSLQHWLCVGDGEHSWCTSVLKTINIKADINKLNGFCMDALRAVQLQRGTLSDIGTLGYSAEQKSRCFDKKCKQYFDAGCICRATGQFVKSNRERTGDDLAGWYSLGFLRNRLMYGRPVYDSMVRTMMRQ